MIDTEKTAIVFGKGRVAISAATILQTAGYDLSFVVPSIEAVNDTSFSDWAESNGVDIRRVSRLDDLGEFHAEIGVSVYYDRIFRQRHIDAFDLLLNVHNSLLPKYRGVRPVNWSLKNGETEHGVSLHLITPGIDEGAVLDQVAFPINPETDEVRDVYFRCLEAAETLLQRSLPDATTLTPVEQDDSAAVYFSAADDDRLGDRRFWTRSATHLE